MPIDKEKIRRSFSESAKHYDRYAGLQYEVMEKLLANLKTVPRRVLDIGSGTGALALLLAGQNPGSEVVGIDIAAGMVEVAAAKVKDERAKFLLGDGEALPFAAAQFDLVVSSLSLQWMETVKVFAEAARVLQPRGSFCFATFGPATLAELKRAGLSVNDFPGRGRLRSILSEYFAGVEVKQEIVTRKYKNIFELFFYLKEIGAQNPAKVCRKGLTSRRKLGKMFAPGRDGISVSYEIYYGSGLKC